MMAALAEHSPFLMAFVARFGGLVLTALGALFLVAVRVSGGAVASFFEGTFGMFSKKLGAVDWRQDSRFPFGPGHDAVGLRFCFDGGDFAGHVAADRICLLRNLPRLYGQPELAAITPSKCVLLMIVSGGASVFQLPVLGWFTQIGVVATAIAGILGAKVEASTACAAMLLIVTFLGIVPVGLIWAQFEHVSLRKVAHESEVAGEEDSPADHGPVEEPSGA